MPYQACHLCRCRSGGLALLFVRAHVRQRLVHRLLLLQPRHQLPPHGRHLQAQVEQVQARTHTLRHGKVVELAEKEALGGVPRCEVTRGPTPPAAFAPGTPRHPGLTSTHSRRMLCNRCSSNSAFSSSSFRLMYVGFRQAFLWLGLRQWWHAPHLILLPPGPCSGCLPRWCSTTSLGGSKADSSTGLAIPTTPPIPPGQGRSPQGKHARLDLEEDALLQALPARPRHGDLGRPAADLPDALVLDALEDVLHLQALGRHCGLGRR